MDGEWAFAGAPGDTLGCSSGAVIVFRHDATSGEWLEEGKLTASDAAAGDWFGSSVSLSGDVALVGAPYDDDAGGWSGSAYVFRHDATSAEWLEEGKLTASDAAAGDWFGSSVSLSGDVALVGALGDDDAGSSSGSAYVFRYDATSAEWLEEGKLTASDAAWGDSFGSSVSLSGEVALVGAPGDGDAGSSSGSAYVFRHDATSAEWPEEGKLTASDAAAEDHFGWSVSLSGDVALVGAPHYDAGFSSGSAYVLSYDDLSGEWLEEGKLTASDAAAGDRFGWSVSLSGDVALVGPPRDDDACLPIECSTCESGAAYFFDLAVCFPGPEFMRGDANGDGGVDVGDAIYSLSYQFSGGPVICLDAADTNDDGAVDLGDAIYGLSYSFSGGPAPPDPWAACGGDPTADDLDCGLYDACP